MKWSLSLLIPALSCALMFSCIDDERAQHTLSAEGILPDSVDFFVGSDTTQIEGYYFVDNIIIAPFSLSHSFSNWGFGFGFTCCQSKDTSTSGYSNLSAITGSGLKGKSYFTVNTGGFYNNLPADIIFSNGNSYNAKSVYITNSVYAYLAITNGDDGNGEYGLVKKNWSNQDWFKLTITGYNRNDSVTGSVSVLLANGLDVLDEWRYVDLSALGIISRINFMLSSTDNGEWGMNTPSYFCLDQLKVLDLISE